MRKRSLWFVVALAVTLAAAGCSSGPTDEQIATAIKARMFSAPELKAANVSVSVAKGEVTLSGEVPNESARYAAYKIASEAQGTLKVNDQMRLAAPPPVVEAKEEPKPEPPARPKATPVKRVAPRTVAAAMPEPAPAAPPAPAPVAAPTAAPVTPAPAPPSPPAEPQPYKVEIPAGTPIPVRLIDPVDTGVNHPGDTFRGTLDTPITVDGDEIIPAGSDVTLRLDEVKSAGRISGRAEVNLVVTSITFQGRRYAVNSSSYERQGRSEGKRSAATIGGVTAAGAIIGAIAGGGKGAAIGAAAGAGAGTAASAATKGQQIVLNSEALLDFRLDAPLTVTVTPGKSDSRRRPSRD